LKVALATCHQMPDLDEDGAILITALERVGVSARPEVWDDRGVDWAGFDLVVIRATSDYIWHRDEFVAWANGVPRLANPPDVLAWNTDKNYLADLAAAGVPVIPTQFFGPAGSDSSKELVSPADLPAGELVVKPAVSSGALDTSLYGSDETDAAADHVRALQLAGRTALVQPYREQVD
jgi:glutathione synthase/RimK-type ligase-like ATP-grasp enzyme